MLIDELVDEMGMEGLLKADGLDGAIIGITQCFNKHSILYDYNECVRILCNRDGMTEEEAEEYLKYNTLDAYVGEGTPTFLIRKLDKTPSKGV